MTVGERISQLRKENNISQSQLAILMNVSRQAVSKWENNLSQPDTMNLIRLAEVLNAEVEFLATGKYASPPPLSCSAGHRSYSENCGSGADR